MDTSTTAEDAAPPRAATAGLSPALSAALAMASYVVPYLLSRSTSPTPDHPRVFFWYRWLKQPSFKPPDVAIPLAWMGIETGLAFAAQDLAVALSAA